MPSMTTMNLAIPEDLATLGEKEASQRGFSSLDELILFLVHEACDAAQTNEETEEVNPIAS